MLEFNIIEHMSYDWRIAAYFFLGGASMGSYFLSVAANYWRKSLQPLARIASIAAVLLLALGMLFLLADLGQPFRFWRLMLTPVPTSALSWGVWFLNIFFVVSSAYAWFLNMGNEAIAKKCAYLGLPFALLVGTYTAVLLSQAPGRVLWHSPLLVPLFLVGGLISGIALVSLIAVMAGKGQTAALLNKFLAWLLVLELGLVFIEILNLFNGGASAIAMADHLLKGEYWFLFWVIEIALGAFIPMAILFRSKVTLSGQAAALVLILIGIFTMRYIVVVGGQVPTF